MSMTMSRLGLPNALSRHIIFSWPKAFSISGHVGYHRTEHFHRTSHIQQRASHKKLVQYVFHYEGTPSKVDLFWKPHLLKLKNPAARDMVMFVDPVQCPFGFDFFSETEFFPDAGIADGEADDEEDFDSWLERIDHEEEKVEVEDVLAGAPDEEQDEKNFQAYLESGDVGDGAPLIEFCREVRMAFPQCLVLARHRGDQDVFCAFGVDGVLLAEHTPFAAKELSTLIQVPQEQLQDTLNILTKLCFSIVVVEAAVPSPYPYVAQIITPDAPVFSHDESQRLPQHFIPKVNES